jgi:hypothetical protein
LQTPIVNEALRSALQLDARYEQIIFRYRQPSASHQHIGGFVNPEALLSGAWMGLLQEGPKPHCAVFDGEFRGGKPSTFQADKHFAPALGALPHAIFNGEKMLLTTVENGGAKLDQGSAAILAVRAA